MVSITKFPLEALEEEVEKRKDEIREFNKKSGYGHTLHPVVRKCMGCGGDFNARQMREHECTMNFHRRIGKVYDSKQKKYVWPEERKT